MIALADQMYEGTAFTMILFPFLSFFLGWIILAVAVWRAGITPLWVAAVIMAATLPEFVGPEVLSPELMFALFLIAFGWLGLKVLRLPDKDREYGEALALTPEAKPSPVV